MCLRLLPVKLKYTKQMSFSVELYCVSETRLFCIFHSRMIVFFEIVNHIITFNKSCSSCILVTPHWLSQFGEHVTICDLLVK